GHLSYRYPLTWNFCQILCEKVRGYARKTQTPSFSATRAFYRLIESVQVQPNRFLQQTRGRFRRHILRCAGAAAQQKGAPTAFRREVLLPEGYSYIFRPANMHK